MNKKLTSRQSDILKFIRTYIGEYGFAPSLREIGAAFGIKSTNGVAAHLNALVKKGVLKKDWRIARGISLKKHSGFQTLPVFGRNVEETGFFSEENITGRLVVDGVFLKGKWEYFSMQDGEERYMVFKKQRFAIGGDLVAALLNNSVVIGNYTDLISLKNTSFEILGVAVLEIKLYT